MLPKFAKLSDDKAGPFGHLQKVSDMAYYAKHDKVRGWFRYFDDSPVGYTGVLGGALDLKFFLVFAYIYSLYELAKKDFRRYYVEREDVLRGKIKGRIKAAKYLNKWISGKRVEIPCRWGEFTYDNWDNRILKGVLNYIREKAYAGSGLLSREVNELLSERGSFVRAHFDEVSDIERWEIDFSKARLRSISKFYRRSLNIAELILKNTDAVANRVYSLKPMYVDMNILFEAFVNAIAMKAFENERVKLQEGNKIFESKDNIKCKPDVVVYKDGEAVFVIDAKYKLLLEDLESQGEGKDIEKILIENIKNKTSDVYQMYFYLSMKSCDIGIIFFPFYDDSKSEVWPGDNKDKGKFIFNTNENRKLYFIGLNLAKDIESVFMKAVKKLGEFHIPTKNNTIK